MYMLVFVFEKLSKVDKRREKRRKNEKKIYMVDEKGILTARPNKSKF